MILAERGPSERAAGARRAGGGARFHTETERLEAWPGR